MANNHADFTPTIPESEITPTRQPYEPVGNFKFWAQKVLPTVYDDSLSYYEVLTKLVWHINKMIEDMDNFNETIDSTVASFGQLQTYVNTTKNTLVETYNELQDYVNHYFDSLDVQAQINNKLDTMASDGTLSRLMAPYIPNIVTEWLDENITPTEPAVDASLSIYGAAADAKITGGIKNTLSGKTNLVLISGDTQDLNGVNFWHNLDGTYQLNGTATSQANFFVGETPALTGTFKLTGCPSTGSNDTYLISIQRNGSWWSEDVGNGTEITLNNDVIRVYITVRSGVTVSNIQFRPMITADLGATYANFYPYGAFLPDYMFSYDRASRVNYLNTGTDLNSVLDQGTYRGDAAVATYTNKPSDVTSIFMLQVYNGDGNYRIQVLSQYVDNDYILYTRYRFGATPTWSNWSRCYKQDETATYLNSTDLDNVITGGLYRGDASVNTYTHKPDELSSIFTLNVINGDGNYRVQIITQYLDSYYAVFTRYRFGATPVWSNWNVGVSQVVKYLDNGTDLNTLLTQRVYRGDANVNTYVNIPSDITSIFLLYVLNGSGNYRVQLLMQYVDNTFIAYSRYRFGATPVWSNWSKIFDQTQYNVILRKAGEYGDVAFENNNTFFKDGEYAQTSVVANEGTKLRILTYNVAHYTKDTQYSTLVFLPNDKRHNFKKMLVDAKPDFMCGQEDSKYIDGAPNVDGSVNTKLALTYLYKPLFPYEYGTEETFIRSKIPATASGDTLKYNSSGRWIRFSTFEVNNKTLLMVCTHNTPNYNGYPIADLQGIRASEYNQLMQWVHGEITLVSYISSQAVSAPTWDYCIICGDFNCTTDVDKNNLKTTASARQFTMANGGWLDWVETWHNTENVNSIDNVICSSNIIIEGVTAYQSYYNSLYSDHYPVVADIVLT